uniref:ATP synthase subunit a n=1 Tax=Belyta sp. ZJUH_2016005 TaxID=2491151 RepID=A0A3S8V0C3_9HYME|nr:ATP synthase F0 subunit 6 [Belyta sp. ZJUH_2016005]
MMNNNLFSIFDITTNNLLSLNYMSMIMALIMMPTPFWMTPSRMMMIFSSMNSLMLNEMSNILKIKKSNINCIMLISLFLIIFINNIISLFPYIFPLNSHMSFSMSYALPLWISIMIALMKNYKTTLIHLTPQSTPSILMPLMVIIETISNLIRPITLSIRLSANIIAGHLIITLISNNINKHFMSMIIILTQSMLMLLELMISFIQAYVFSILMTLYSAETN